MVSAARDLDTVAGLLAVVASLPPAARRHAGDRIEDAVAGDARRCRALLGQLALELAPAVAAHRLDDVEVLVDLAAPAAQVALPTATPALSA